MLVRDLNKIKTLNIINNTNSLDNEITEFYSCDLLSFAMGHATTEGTCLITAIANMNTIAVASLLDYSAIIFVENISLDSEVIEKSEKLGIPLFNTSLSSLKIYKEILCYENQI